MMHLEPTLQSELLTCVGQLPPVDQARVIAFARTLADNSERPIRGVPGKELLKFAGCISHEDAMEMMAAIEEGCEQIDASTW
jgi:hypothetical protein